MLPRFTFVASLALVLGVSAYADELKLKDGTKIVGTIVGFEENSFKVKTSYGFAVVQRDQVVSISVSDAAKKPDTEKKPEADKKVEPAAEKPASAKPPKTETATAVSPAVSSQIPPAAARDASGTLERASAVPTGSSHAPITPVANANANANANASSPPAASPKPIAPEPIREQVSGNTYINETYGFRMYKPPDWDLIAGARTILPGAIAAMGTSDQTTYLLIGQNSAGKSLSGDIDATEGRLRDVMENFRPLGEKRVTVSGSEAIERRFRGSVDQHDWSGIVVVVPRGKQVYTIFGMTYADNDLVQIQENVISRAIASLQFTK